MVSVSLLLLGSAGAGLPGPPDPSGWVLGGLVAWAALGVFPIVVATSSLNARARAIAVVAATALLVCVLSTYGIYRGYRSEVRDYEALPLVDAAENTAAPDGTLLRLAGSGREAVRLAVAANTAAPAGVLDILSSDPEKDVRAAVASNPSTPPETLAMLAQDRSVLVRSCVGQNPSIPQHVLAALARDHDPQVRIAAVRNPSAGPDVLAAVGEFEVSAAHALDAPERGAPASPADTETRGNVAARVAVASNPHAGTVLLAELARDPSPAVRTAAAANPSLPARALGALLNDDDDAVSAAARDAISPAGDDLDTGAPDADRGGDAPAG